MTPPKSLGRRGGDETARPPRLRPARSSHCPSVPGERKGDPPRGPYRGGCAFVDRAHDPGDRVGLLGSRDGGGGHAGGSQHGLRRSMRGCSRRGPGRSVGKWRRRSGSPGIGPAALISSHSPRPLVRRDAGITIDAPGSVKTCDNPGRSSLLPSKTGARPLEGSEDLLRVLTRFGQR